MSAHLLRQLDLLVTVGPGGNPCRRRYVGSSILAKLWLVCGQIGACVELCSPWVMPLTKEV